MTQRRHFILILPFGAASLLAACSKTEPDASAMPAPAPAPAPEATAPVPAPMAPPAVADAPAAAPAMPTSPATTASLSKLEESNPIAVSLGYVDVASRADTSRFKNYAAGQNCANCSLFGAKTGEAAGPCPIFTGYQVMAAGWCSAYVKKAA